MSETFTPKEFGETLRNARLAAGGYSPADVGKHLDISAIYILNLENNEIKFPAPHILYELAKFYGIDYKKLMILCGHLVKKDLQKEIKAK